MRRYVLLVALLTLGFTGSSAEAATMSFTDEINPPDFTIINTGNDCTVTFTAPCDEYSYLHDITDNGFTPGTDNLLMALLTVTLRDDSDMSAEKVQIFLNGIQVSPAGGTDPNANFVYTFGNITVFTNLASDGLLNVLLDAQAGDFTFERSDLAVSWEDSGILTAVPEPASLSLLGLGLAGAAAVRRAKRWK